MTDVPLDVCGANSNGNSRDLRVVSCFRVADRGYEREGVILRVAACLGVIVRDAPLTRISDKSL